MPHNSRPGTASSSRPRTATATSYEGPQQVENSDSILRKEIGEDTLLRILGHDQISDDNNAILYAESGNIVGIRQMISHGLNMKSIKGLRGYSLLHYACNRGHLSIAAELLKSYSIPVDIVNDDGETALHLAVYSGSLLVVELLLDRFATVNCANEYGETPLFYAARRAYPALVRLLLARGADASRKDTLGESAAQQAGDTPTKRAFAAWARSVNSSSAISPSSSINDSKRGGLSERDDLTHLSSSVANWTVGGGGFELSSPCILLPYTELLLVFKYLAAKDVCRAACVCSKWHRVSECEEIWTSLRIRRWEIALQSTLGFGPPAMTSFKLLSKGSRSTSGKNTATFGYLDTRIESKEMSAKGGVKYVT